MVEINIIPVCEIVDRKALTHLILLVRIVKAICGDNITLSITLH